jgi:hypothetical protein
MQAQADKFFARPIITNYLPTPRSLTEDPTLTRPQAEFLFLMHDIAAALTNAAKNPKRLYPAFNRVPFQHQKDAILYRRTQLIAEGYPDQDIYQLMNGSYSLTLASQREVSGLKYTLVEFKHTHQPEDAEPMQLQFVTFPGGELALADASVNLDMLDPAEILDTAVFGQIYEKVQEIIRNQQVAEV